MPGRAGAAGGAAPLQLIIARFNLYTRLKVNFSGCTQYVTYRFVHKYNKNRKGEHDELHKRDSDRAAAEIGGGGDYGPSVTGGAIAASAGAITRYA